MAELGGELQREVKTTLEIPMFLAWVEHCVRQGLSRGPVRVSVGQPRRTLGQNARLAEGEELE